MRVTGKELWLPIPGFEHYNVSSRGRIRRTDKENDRKIGVNAQGNAIILLSEAGNGRRHLRQVNRLVAGAFLGPPPDLESRFIWHLDGNLLNCDVLNLKWERKDRVVEWNRMHREGRPMMQTPKVMINASGLVFDNAYECAMHDGVLESHVVFRIEKQANGIFDPYSKYRYVE